MPLLQGLHAHKFHQRIGKRRIIGFIGHVGPALLPTAQSVFHIGFGLRGINRATLAIHRSLLIDFIHAVVHAVSANQIDAEAVQMLGSLHFL